MTEVCSFCLFCPKIWLPIESVCMMNWKKAMFGNRIVAEKASQRVHAMEGFPANKSLQRLL